MNADDTALVIAHTSSGAEELAKRVPKARLVSAFGTVPSEVLFDVFERRRNATKPSLVYCGDESKSKKTDRKSTRLNSSHSQISYAVFCLKKKNNQQTQNQRYATSH